MSLWRAERVAALPFEQNPIEGQVHGTHGDVVHSLLCGDLLRCQRPSLDYDQKYLLFPLYNYLFLAGEITWEFRQPTSLLVGTQNGKSRRRASLFCTLEPKKKHQRKNRNGGLRMMEAWWKLLLNFSFYDENNLGPFYLPKENLKYRMGFKLRKWKKWG